MAIHDIKTAAKGRWQSILLARGVPESSLNGKHHPCPKSGGVDRFRWDDKAERFYCHCRKGGDGLDLLQCLTGAKPEEIMREIGDEVGTKPTAEDRQRQAEEQRKRDTNVERLKRLVKASKSDSPIVRQYLENRGLSARKHPPTLLGIEAIRYFEDDASPLRVTQGMLAVIRNAAGAPVSLHVTYLVDGAKANVPSPRKVMPPSGRLAGGAAHLWPLADSETLLVAEGIETTIAARQLWGNRTGELVPAWACISADMLRQFDPPPGVKKLVIYGDNDESFTGQACAYELARRAKTKGLDVVVVIPGMPGQDALDVMTDSFDVLAVQHVSSAPSVTLALGVSGE